MSYQRNSVPCNGCKACCKHQRVILSVEHGDVSELYKTVPNRLGVDAPHNLMLAHKPNGDCIYLGEDGCTIHDFAPWACRMFDCRKWLAGFPEAMQDLLTPDDIDGEIVTAARARMETLWTANC